MIFSLQKENNEVMVYVYESLADFSKRVEWQDLFNHNFIIIDRNGNIYKWDETKKQEYGTTYNYTLISKTKDAELGKICNMAYAESNYATEFIMAL